MPSVATGARAREGRPAPPRRIVAVSRHWMRCAVSGATHGFASVSEVRPLKASATHSAQNDGAHPAVSMPLTRRTCDDRMRRVAWQAGDADVMTSYWLPMGGGLNAVQGHLRDRRRHRGGFRRELRAKVSLLLVSE